MSSQSYINKMIMLSAVTIAGIFVIWYSLIREESVDWISSRVIHQVSPYAVTTVDDGRVIIDNVIIGYGFSLPKGFKTAGARNFVFYLEAAGRKQCEIRHYYIKADKAKPEATTAEKMVIPLNEMYLIFELTGPAAQKAACSKYLIQIQASLTVTYLPLDFFVV